MRTTRVAIVVLALVGVLPARAANTPAALAPYEDLLEVLTTLTWHLDDDLYRFPIPKDPTGHDVFGLTLSRLVGWEQRFPGRMRDVTTFARAQSLERARAYREATDGYREVAAMPTSELAAPAEVAARRTAAFADANALPETGPSVQARLDALSTKLDAWAALTPQYPDQPYQALIRLEEERLEVLAADEITRNMHLIEDGPKTAEQALRFLVQKHAESKALADHVLRLADFYGARARRYALENARPLEFDGAEFVQRVDLALDTYQKIATWDGSPARPVGRGCFEALEAFKDNELERHR